MSNVLEQMQKDLCQGNVTEVEAAAQQALDEGMSAREILDKGLIAGMDVVGARFKAGDLFIPEVLMAAKAMHAGLEVLRPQLVRSGAPSLGKVVIGTVAGDLHDIGKNLVGMMLEGAGFDIVDLGSDVAPAKFVEALRAEEANLIGMSSLLTTTMPAMESTIQAVAEAGLRDQVKILVGGAPVTASFADKIGADGYAPDAASAVDAARSFIV